MDIHEIVHCPAKIDDALGRSLFPKLAAGNHGLKGEHDLAKKSGLSSVTVRYVENETNSAKKETIEKIVEAFNDVGIEFIENDGVRRRPKGIEVYEGPEHFTAFFDFMYDYLKQHGGDLCAGGQDARLYSKYRKDPHIHRERMTKLVKEGNVTVRFLVKEGDDYLPAAAYAQFKWEPEESFVPTSFYAFGDCLALVSFVHERPPYVVLLKSGPFAEVYRQAFNVIWNKARNVPPEILEKARNAHA